MTKEVFEIRDKPIWYCSQCDEPIYIQDIIFTFVCTSREIKNTRIKCPRRNCGHVDTPGEVKGIPLKAADLRRLGLLPKKRRRKSGKTKRSTKKSSKRNRQKTK